MEQILEVKGLVKRYGKRLALDGLDLSVRRGEVFGLVGSNGAGKTTTMAILAGLVKKTSGIVNIFGQGDHDPERHAGRMTLMPQDADLPNDSCVGDLVAFYAELQGMNQVRARQNAEEVIAKVNLSDRINSSVRTLSHGMKRRVVIAQAFLGDPEFILLDEPLSGLDPREVVNIREVILKMKGRRTVVISSHNLHEIERMCGHVAFIEAGKTMQQDALHKITGNNCVIKYQLSESPSDSVALAEVVPDVGTDIKETADGGCVLVCRYDEQSYGAAELNALVLKHLLDNGVGVISVQQGDGLEGAYIALGDG